MNSYLLIGLAVWLALAAGYYFYMLRAGSESGGRARVAPSEQGGSEEDRVRRRP